MPHVDSLWRDARVAVRGFASRPAFTAACVTTLALALGANVAIFTLIDRVLLRPLDVPDPSTLVTVVRTDVAAPRRGVMPRGDADRVAEISAFDRSALSTTGPMRSVDRLSVTVDGTSQPAEARFVSADYFRVLGAGMALGRDFAPRDDAASAPDVVILSYRYWRTRFGASADAVGRTVRINQSSSVVIGVTARTFQGTQLGVPPPDIFLPLSAAPSFSNARVPPDSRLIVLARLAAGGVERAQAELDALDAGRHWAVVPLSETMLPFDSREEVYAFFVLLAGAVGLTLLIGCANLAGLLLARADERRLELLVRSALGAGRSRLVQQTAVEAALLAAAGGFVGLIVARWTNAALSSFMLPGGVAVSSLRNGTDGRVLLFAIFATAAAAIVIGIAPAVRAAGANPVRGLGGHGRGSARMGFTRTLVCVQVAISIVLVFGGALFVRSVSNALAIDVGFNPRGLASAAIATPEALMQVDGLAPVDALVEHVRTFPGVSAVTAGPLPLVRGADMSYASVFVDGVPRTLPSPVDVAYASADYFTTLQQPVVQGRDFDGSDRNGARRVAILNEAAARLFWPDGDALERQIGLPGGPPPRRDYVVIGIVHDVKVRSLRDTGQPVIYLSRLQHQAYLAGFSAGSGSSFLILRTTVSADTAREPLSRAAAERGLTLLTLTTLEQAIDQMLMPERLGRILLLTLGAAALLCALIGIYGLVSSLIARSRKEIGVRIALGAGSEEILRAVTSRALTPVAIGLAAGTAVAWVAGPFADRFMYGIAGSDPWTIGVAAAATAAAAALAALLSARRALRLDPIEILRAD